jgi:hypothetical protein
MKQTKLSLAILCTLLVTSISNSFAQGVAYMCNQAGIKFSIPANASAYDQAQWFLGSTQLVNGTNGVTISSDQLTLSISNSSTLFQLATATAAETKTVSVKVAKTVEGCYSELQNYTVNVLPKPVVTMGSVTNYCADNPSNSATLTVNTNVLTNLPTGVTANKFVWNQDGNTIGEGTITSPAAGQWKSELTYTSPANTTALNYSVTTTYNLPANATLIGGCVSEAATATVQSYAAPAAPGITVSDL